jgi:hypothetical protein
MKKCNTCGIIAHPHKDFYPSQSLKNVCKRCRPAIRDLYYKNLVSRISGNSHLFTYSETEIFLILHASKQRELKSHKRKFKSIKYNINVRLKILGRFYCKPCKKAHPINKKINYKKTTYRCKKAHQAENKKWRECNPNWCKDYYKSYMNEYKKDDTLYKFYTSIRQLVRQSINGKGYTKKSQTHEILGCDFETFKLHIERQFTKGMSWDNRSKWHIDHIYPISLAQNEEEAIKLNHYTNLRPMWAIENISKGNRIIQHQLKIPI